MIRIAVCEDEEILLHRLASLVRDIFDKHGISYSVETYLNGSSLLAHEAFDILLLDIEMEPLNGLETAKRLRRRGDESKLIFITSHPQYAIEAYDVQTYHYLLKPVDEKKLEALLMTLCSILAQERQQAISVRQGTRMQRVPLDRVLYLEVLDRQIYLHTTEETIPFYGKLEELELKLPGSFLRCHRSYIVHLYCVRKYDKKEITLCNGERIPLSRRRYQSFGLAFMQYIKESGDVC